MWVERESKMCVNDRRDGVRLRKLLKGWLKRVCRWDRDWIKRMSSSGNKKGYQASLGTVDTKTGDIVREFGRVKWSGERASTTAAMMRRTDIAMEMTGWLYRPCRRREKACEWECVWAAGVRLASWFECCWLGFRAL